VVKLGGTVGVAEARILDEKGALVARGRALFLTRAPEGEKEAKA
jgi:acyl-coenzyme A thioesterase PaaI-like protein